MDAIRIRARLAGWWSAWKYVAILAIALGLALWGNVHQYGTQRAAAETCRTHRVEAARLAIVAERERAAKADRQAGDIVDKNRRETRDGVTHAQEGTNARDAQIQAVVVHGDCRMPDGLPSLQPAIDAANAAAGE
jgi:hypothetical protein